MSDRAGDPQERARLRRLIQAETRPIRPPLTPELEYWGADDYAAIWSATEERLDELALPPPFWAFAWPGGQALARWLLDHPDLANGKKTLAIAAGAGLEAIAAARAGAAQAVSNDVDPAAAEAVQLNAALNGVSVEACLADLTENPAGGRLDPRCADLVLLGDALYEKPLAERLLTLLGEAARAGATVLIASPDRGFQPSAGVEILARLRAPTRVELEDRAYRDVAILKLTA